MPVCSGGNEAGNPAQETVPAGKERGQDVVHDGVLSGDRAAELDAEA
jgi:hypothetical protein